jgi:hypothetical protein
MESTGFTESVFEILEQRGFEVMVVNAREAKHVPGRKTHVSDAQWLQRLHEYGLLRAYLRQWGRLLDYRTRSVRRTWGPDNAAAESGVRIFCSAQVSPSRRPARASFTRRMKLVLKSRSELSTDMDDSVADQVDPLKGQK